MKTVIQLPLPTLLMALSLLVACQKEVIRETVHDVVPSQQSQPQGGVDGGGGNGVNGKPLESYAVKLSTLSEYSEDIVPLMKEIRNSFPELNADFQYLVGSRGWYFVPVSLDKIPSFRIGAYFPTDQLAYQTRGSVWLDDILYQKMDRAGKVKLLLHELLMGVRILEQLNSLEKCFAAAELAADPSAYREARRICIATYKVGSDVDDALHNGRHIEISQDDYDLIRSTVSLILDSGGKIDGKELRSIFEVKKFRIYPAN